MPLTDARRRLAADCTHCRALCCVGPGFARSRDFPVAKAPGVPCPNLDTSLRCRIHDALPARGFHGCIGYDCFGAGQLVSAAVPAATPDVAHALLPVVRLLHELEWYLLEALDRTTATAQHTAASDLLATTRALAARTPDEILAAHAAGDVDAHRAAVAPVLRAVSRAVRTASGGPGRDLAGADLAGHPLGGADLRRADLRGAVLLGTDLSRADLRGADLLGADTRGADLRGADLRDALFLTRTQADAARSDLTTRWPHPVASPG